MTPVDTPVLLELNTLYFGLLLQRHLIDFRLLLIVFVLIHIVIVGRREPKSTHVNNQHVTLVTLSEPIGHCIPTLVMFLLVAEIGQD